MTRSYKCIRIIMIVGFQVISKSVSCSPGSVTADCGSNRDESETIYMISYLADIVLGLLHKVGAFTGRQGKLVPGKQARSTCKIELTHHSRMIHPCLEHHIPLHMHTYSPQPHGPLSISPVGRS